MIFARSTILSMFDFGGRPEDVLEGFRVSIGAPVSGILEVETLPPGMAADRPDDTGFDPLGTETEGPEPPPAGVETDPTEPESTAGTGGGVPGIEAEDTGGVPATVPTLGAPARDAGG